MQKAKAASKAVQTAIGILLIALLAACAAPIPASQQHEKWELTEAEQPSAVEGVAQGAVNVVIYRTMLGSKAQNDIPVNIYINGQYQSSLTGDTYTQQALCPGVHTLSVRYRDADKLKETPDFETKLQINSNKNQYFNISKKADGNLSVRNISDPSMSQRLGLNLRQVHTISRVTNNGC